jgi:hypothetical protein
LIAKAEPVFASIGFISIRKIALVSVADEEQVSEHIYARTLPSVSEQLAHRQLEKLPEQVKQGSLNCGSCMHSDALVEGLKPAPCCIFAREPILYGLQNGAICCDVLSFDERPGRFEDVPDLLSAGHFPDAHIAGAVLEND